MTLTGDVLVSFTSDEELDIQYKNGQPDMTDGFESCVLLAVFGESCVLNAATSTPSDVFSSTFPAVIARANVSDETRQNGEKAIEKALAFMVSDGMASSVSCTGRFPSARSIMWEISIVSPTGTTKYAVNWEKGSLTAGFGRI